MSEKKSTTYLIKKCSCKHAYQDQKYGKGNRVFNCKLDRGKLPTCTVCGKTS